MEKLTTDEYSLPTYLTTAEVAELARLSAKTIRNRVYRGLPPHPVRVASRLRFRLKDVQAWLAGEGA